jgi:hypothetical protein
MGVVISQPKLEGPGQTQTKERQEGGGITCRGRQGHPHDKTLGVEVG